MEDYKTKLDRRTITIILLSIILLPAGYLSIYYIQCSMGPIKTLENKYGKKSLQKNCPWSEKKTYLQCVKKDFLKVVRKTGPFDSHLAYLFEKDLFRLDRDKQSTDIGKVNTIVDHLELGVNFLIIRRDFRVLRSNLHLAGFLLAYLTRNDVLDEFNKFEGYIKLIETKYGEALKSDGVIHQRYTFVKKEFLKFKPKLVDLN